jgi:hypothetical protein
MDAGVLEVTAAPLFVHRTSAADEALQKERAARIHAERVASNMALLVAAESRRAEDEKDLRLRAEAAASGMAKLIAHESARAEEAELRLAAVLQLQAA